MTAHDAEVLIVGGGPAGSTAAFFLARAGCDVLLADRATFPRDKVCSEYLSPQASRLLHEMGVLESLEAGPSAQLTGMRIHAPDGTTFQGSFSAATGYRAFRDYGLAIRRPILDTALLQSAERAGARIRTGVDVRDLVRDGSGRVTGVVAREGNSQTTLRARLVIGADGLRSVVARRAKLGRHGRWPRRLALVRHFHGVTHDASVGDMHVFEGGYAGFAPVGGALTNVAVAAYDRCRRREFSGKWAVERAIAMAIASPPLINLAARALARRSDLADLLVGVTGDFVPAREVLKPQYSLRLLAAALLPERTRVSSPLPAASWVAEP